MSFVKNLILKHVPEVREVVDRLTEMQIEACSENNSGCQVQESVITLQKSQLVLAHTLRDLVIAQKSIADAQTKLLQKQVTILAELGEMKEMLNKEKYKPLDCFVEMH